MGCGGYSKPKELRDRWFPDFVKTLPRLDGKAVAITGCTTGTGLVCAQTCARLGAKVYLLNRTSERSAKALKDVQACAEDPSRVVDVPCDLQSFASVKKAIDELRASDLGSQGLDVLVNNAGVMALKTAPTVDGFEVQMQTNMLSHFLLTQGLMPMLDKAAELRGSARIVNHTSVARNQGRRAGLQAKYFGKDLDQLGGDGLGGRWGRYNQTKYANIVFTEAFADRLEQRDPKSKVIAVSAHPGGAATNLAVTTHADGGAPSLLAKGFAQQSAADGAMGILRGACGTDVRMRDFFSPKKDRWSGPAESLPHENSPNQDRNTLWLECEKACGVSFTL